MAKAESVRQSLGILFAASGFGTGLFATIGVLMSAATSLPLEPSTRVLLSTAALSAFGIAAVIVDSRFAGAAAVGLGLIGLLLSVLILVSGGGDWVYRLALPIGIGGWSIVLLALGVLSISKASRLRKEVELLLLTVICLALAVPWLVGR